MILVVSKVRAIAKANGKRVSKEFLTELDRRVNAKIEAACRVHNGGKVTLDGVVLAAAFGQLGRV